MFFIRSIYGCFKEWLSYLGKFLKLHLKSTQAIKLENIALRSQLALYIQRYEKEKLPKPKPTQAFRQLWVFLSKHFESWKDVLIIVKPDTVIRWHRTAFKFYWKQKSRKIGRPTLDQASA